PGTATARATEEQAGALKAAALRLQLRVRQNIVILLTADTPNFASRGQCEKTAGETRRYEKRLDAAVSASGLGRRPF
ncbi:MAG: hypothetical protein ACRD3S_07170, partial [Terracidiphilus sp.]